MFATILPNLFISVCCTGRKKSSRIISNDVLFVGNCGVCDVPGGTTFSFLFHFWRYYSLNVYRYQVEILKPLGTDAFESTIVTGHTMVCCSMDYIATKPRHHLLFENANQCIDINLHWFKPKAIPGTRATALQIRTAYSKTACSSLRWGGHQKKYKPK